MIIRAETDMAKEPGADMAKEHESKKQVRRTYEQPTDAISFYSDMAQIIGTGQEVVLQFYETIPGAPAVGGEIDTVRSRLRATITISMAHAANIGSLLLEQIGKAREPRKEGEQP